MSDKIKHIVELDGAGIIYPYVAEADWNSVYRIEIKLKDTINVSAIRNAIIALKEKYPYYFLTITRNKTRYFLTQCDVDVDKLYYIDDGPCKPFDLEAGQPLIRFLYDTKSIKFEVFHSITDGRGALEFVKAFLLEYKEDGKSSEYNEFLLNTEDLFERIYANGGKSVSRVVPFAYKIGRKEPVDLNYQVVEIMTKDLVNSAHRYGVSVSVLLCALHIKAIAEFRADTRKKITISVPIDLRKMFDFYSCRNSSLYFLVSVSQEDTKDFKELLLNLKKQFEDNLNVDDMRNMAYSNVKQAKIKAFKILPVEVKKKILKIGYTVFGENQFTSALTSIGVIRLGDEIEEFVDDIYFALGKQYTHPINIAATTYKDKSKIVVSYDIKPDLFIKDLDHLIKAYIYE